MKQIWKFALTLLFAILIFVAYTFISTGFFRKVEPKFDGEILHEIPLTGAEDITISLQDSFAIISATDRADKSKDRFGGLYFLDLKTDQLKPTLLTNTIDFDFQPHGISFYKQDSIYHVAAINHPKEQHTIEFFELKDGILTHKRTLTDAAMVQPNDLVLIDQNRFYFTNDHGYTRGIGKTFEEYLGLSLSNAVYFDGKNYREVADGIAYANGINYDPNRNLMFIASPRKFEVKVYQRLDNGDLSHLEDIPCGTGVDNIEFDASGDLWIGCHPNLLGFSAYRAEKKDISPSEVIQIKYNGINDYTVKKVYVEDGSQMSASTVAAVFGKLILVGNVMDDNFLVLKKE